MSNSRVLVIIVTWNKKKYVLELLDSLKNINYQSDLIDILVVDNASNDGTVEAIQQLHPQVNLLCNAENLGGTGGFNTGLAWAFEQAEGYYDYLWLLDNDVLVHCNALKELVQILNEQPSIAIAGSTMMQLDYPWRINEMGAYVDRGRGELVLNRHLQEIDAWHGLEVSELLQVPADLSKSLIHCQAFMDVDYVAAASLLIRSDVARQAGLWRDYFIHFDDVEWCLRIRAQGNRVVVSAKSLIWHLSAAAKVPTWVLYYDNRNILDLLKTHGANEHHLHQVKTSILKKALYYHLLGKSELAQLHYSAINDFEKGHFGKKEITLNFSYQANSEIMDVFMNPQFKRVLVSWMVNLQATNIQSALVLACLQRPDLEVIYLNAVGNPIEYQLPNARFLVLPASRWRRLWHYFKLRKQYDLVVQSDYAPFIWLSWLSKEKTLFINDDGFCLFSKPQWSAIWHAGWRWVKHRLKR